MDWGRGRQEWTGKREVRMDWGRGRQGIDWGRGRQKWNGEEGGKNGMGKREGQL